MESHLINKIKYCALLSLLLCVPSIAIAQTAPPLPAPTPESLQSILATIKASSIATNTLLVEKALKTLFVALSLQWALTHWKELFQGEMTTILAKSVGMLMWAMGAFYLLKHQEILFNMFEGYMGLAGEISGVKFNPADIWSNGVQLQADLATGFYTRNADDFWATVKNILPGLGILLACLLIMLAYGVIALSVLVAIAEFWLIMAVAPLAIALIGLSAFRDQGSAPVKGVMSVGLRIILLGVIIKTLTSVQQTAVSAFKTLPADQPMTVVWYALGGVFACAVMAFYSGKIASSIASGTANFSGSDAIRGGMTAAGVAGTAVTAAATVTSAIGSTASAAKGGVGRAVEAAAGAFGGRGAAVGVAPSSNSGGKKIGDPVGAPPLPPGAGDVFKSMGSGSSNSGGGSSASGGESGGIGKSIAGAAIGGAPSTSNKPGIMDHLKHLTDSGGRSASALTDDNHAVGVQINLRGE